MAQSEPLTEEEYRAFKPSRLIINQLERVRVRLGIPKSAMRVLDWGCGRGASVAFLREAGYSAYGVDIDTWVSARGEAVLRARGYDPTDLLRPVSQDNRTSFSDSFFHFVSSYTVLEHVADLNAVARELYRLTHPGGEGLHIFPGQRRVIEGHLYMPFLQWLPKGPIRRCAISAWVTLGVEPRWSELHGKPSRDRIGTYSRFMDEMTFYRPLTQIHDAFRAVGFSTDSAVLQHPRLIWLRHPLVPQVVGSVVDATISTFRTVNLVVTKY